MDSFSIRDAMVMISCREYGDALMSASILSLIHIFLLVGGQHLVIDADAAVNGAGEVLLLGADDLGDVALLFLQYLYQKSLLKKILN